jgi:hypothetical protein
MNTPEERYADLRIMPTSDPNALVAAVPALMKSA